MAYDAIVIGAGIEGSSTGYNLLKKGLKNVLLLEQVLSNMINTTHNASLCGLGVSFIYTVTFSIVFSIA